MSLHNQGCFSVFHHLQKDKQRKQRHSLKLGKERRESSKRNYYIISPRVIIKAIIILVGNQCSLVFKLPRLRKPHIIQLGVCVYGPQLASTALNWPQLIAEHLGLFSPHYTILKGLLAGVRSNCCVFCLFSIWTRPGILIGFMLYLLSLVLIWDHLTRIMLCLAKWIFWTSFQNSPCHTRER